MKQNMALTFVVGAIFGTLGGLIGLGGAEFRLPILIGLFGFAALPAVILNKSMSLVVVASALLFRTRVVPYGHGVRALADDRQSLGRKPARCMDGCGVGDEAEEPDALLSHRSAPRRRSPKPAARNWSGG